VTGFFDKNVVEKIRFITNILHSQGEQRASCKTPSSEGGNCRQMRMGKGDNYNKFIAA
jgi:hypothetical protein